MRKELALVITCIMLSIAAYGCSRQYVMEDEEGRLFGSKTQRYTVLSLFFDGVPDPEKADKAAQSANNVNNNNNNTRGPERAQYSEHGPYAARLCEGCHLRGTNRLVAPIEELCSHCHSFNLDKKRIHGPLASGGCRVCHNPHDSAYRLLLVSESKDFCFHCHNKNDVYKRDVHGGDLGACTKCHDAHSSDNDFLLK